MSLALDRVGLDLHGARLLEDVSFAVEQGEVLAILGPNGAGKSTLLRVLCGEWPATTGTVTFNGRPIQHWRPADKARAMGVLPQDTSLEFPFTVEEVVMLGRTPHRSGQARDRAIVAETLAAVDGGHLRGRIYTRLSGGEKQRVQLARVLAQIWEERDGQHRLLLLDEPTASFDLAHQQLTLDLVRRLAGQGFAVVMVLHDLNMAARCATRMLLLSCGRVWECGPPEAVLTPDNIREVFGVRAVIEANPLTGAPLVIT
ncbi:MAG: heme ABC transporter ATP-binding protein [Porticoccaceae bacterium]|jgi:iron complex transport system ATP-binding protein|nr:heme ABC transporter ATP-binding protein [Porticoccaceae bacterium]